MERLDGAFERWEAIAAEMSPLTRSRGLRPALSAIPEIDTRALPDDRHRERALLLLTVFANGWVWGGIEPDPNIPPQISIPLCALADRMDRPPLVHYASMALNNWRRVDPSRPVVADNLTMQIQFLGGVDEDWFFIGSLGVELAGVPLIGAVERAVRAAGEGEDNDLANELDTVGVRLLPVIAALEAMRDWCDPHVFYHRVRPFLAGWPDPGVRYCGVSDDRRIFSGGSAGQSSLIQAVDAALGVNHGAGPHAAYLRSLRAYMPPGHRRFVTDLETESRIRDRSLNGSARLQASYNAAISEIARFRQAHIGLAQDYIVRPSDAAATTGTGGTAFDRFLDAARQSTVETQL